MKVLLSAFECNPLIGSDPYVGWSWVINMAKINEVWVLLREDHRPYIERYISENKLENVENIHFIYIDCLSFFGNVVNKINPYLSVVGAYYVWHRDAYKVAKKLNKEINFDIVHLVSIADFRFPGYLWKLNIPYIFGPVGGAQETPICLKDYLIGHEKSEKFRTSMNNFFQLLPNYSKALKHANRIYCSNDETQQLIEKKLPKEQIKKVYHLTELGINNKYLLDRYNIEKKQSGVVHIIVSGRMIYRKGLMLLLDSLHQLRTERKYVVDIFGDGEQKNEILNKIDEYNLNNIVLLHGKVSFEEMQNMYKEADIYCLPSLRETTGTSVFEAMANKLPVVALKQNGVKYIVQDDAGILVNIENKEQVITEFAKALKCLIEDDEKRVRLGQQAYKKIQEQYTWNERIDFMNKVYKEVITDFNN